MASHIVSEGNRIDGVVNHIVSVADLVVAALASDTGRYTMVLEGRLCSFSKVVDRGHCSDQMPAGYLELEVENVRICGEGELWKR